MTRRPCRVALGQIALTMGDKAANLQAVEAMIEQAAAVGSDLLVLPECCFAGWTSPAAATAAEAIPGPFTRRLARLAKLHRLAICAGFEERQGDQLFNAALLLSETGELRLRHRKINELALARSLYQTGGKIEVTSWRGYTVGIAICADSWRPEIAEALAVMGADLILSPCAWAVEPGGESTNLAWITECYRQRIGTRPLTFLAANAVGFVSTGPWAGRILQGNSLIVGPGGRVEACGATSQPGLILWELPPATS